MSKEKFEYTVEMALYEIWGALQAADDMYSFSRAKTVARNAIRRIESLEENQNQNNGWLY